MGGWNGGGSLLFFIVGRVWKIKIIEKIYIMLLSFFWDLKILVVCEELVKEIRIR